MYYIIKILYFKRWILQKISNQLLKNYLRSSVNLTFYKQNSIRKGPPLPPNPRSPTMDYPKEKNLEAAESSEFSCRIITGKRKFDHITPVLRELRWLPVTSFLKYTLGVLAFKCVNGLAPSYLCNRFKTRACVHDCNTRYNNNLNISAYKSASGQRTFLYRAMSFWNSLPCKIREYDSLPIFKRHLKEFLSSL